MAIADTISVLKKRQDFLAAKKGAVFHAPSFVLQSKAAERPTETTARFGITVTKRVGNAVVRNRVKRRLREVIRQTASGHAKAGFDYVLIAREKALHTEFSELTKELASALDRTARHSAKVGTNSGKTKRSTPSDKASNHSTHSKH